MKKVTAKRKLENIAYEQLWLTNRVILLTIFLSILGLLIGGFAALRLDEAKGLPLYGLVGLTAFSLSFGLSNICYLPLLFSRRSSLKGEV